jgi:hypothetical protein
LNWKLASIKEETNQKNEGQIKKKKKQYKFDERMKLKANKILTK